MSIYMAKRLLSAVALMVIAVGVAVLESSCSAEYSDGNDGASDSDSDGDMDADSDADSDGDMDMDSDSDSDMDSDMDTDTDTYPPEDEDQTDYMVPKGAGRYVFIADENHDSIAVIDSETLAIKIVGVGSRPTNLAVLSDDATSRVAVINLDSDEVTIIKVSSLSSINTKDIPIRPDTNALVASPDGAFIVAFCDPRFIKETGPPTTDQEISIIDTTEGSEKVYDFVVGMHPWAVTFDDKGSKAFIITEDGISIIDLTTIEDNQRPIKVSPFEGGTYDSSTADIEITPDGSIALARKVKSEDLVVVELKESGDMRTYTMSSIPTDLDVAPNGSFGTMVLRSSGQVALFNLPLPADPKTDPFTFIDLEGRVAGVATLTPDGNSILLHTTTAGDSEDKQRLTLLTRDEDTWQVQSTVLEREIHSVVAGVDSSTAVAIHERISPSDTELPYAYSLVAIPSMQIKFQQIPVKPGQLLLTPDGNYGFLLQNEDSSVDIIKLGSFIVDNLKLGSPPVAGGYAAGTNKAFISQDHPAGRMTFYGIGDGTVKTVTGYFIK